MKTRLMAVVVTACLMAGCSGNKPSGMADGEAETLADTAQTDTTEVDTMEMLIADTPMPKAADELFDDFLFNYAANRSLQMERTRFPLTVHSAEGTTTIGRKEWATEHFFMHQGFYTLIFDTEKQMAVVKDTAVAKATVERVDLDAELLRRYVFERNGGLWMLCEISTEPLSDCPDADFLRFYKRFASDTDYQLESLRDPVTFIGPDPDDDFNQIEGVITAETWPAFAAEMPSGTIYNIDYGQQRGSSTQKLFVIRGISNGLEVEMTFRRLQGRWMLTKLCT